jgi:hypothetical protein
VSTTNAEIGYLRSRLLRLDIVPVCVMVDIALCQLTEIIEDLIFNVGG